MHRNPSFEAFADAAAEGRDQDAAAAWIKTRGPPKVRRLGGGVIV